MQGPMFVPPGLFLWTSKPFICFPYFIQLTLAFCPYDWNQMYKAKMIRNMSHDYCLRSEFIFSYCFVTFLKCYDIPFLKGKIWTTLFESYIILLKHQDFSTSLRKYAKEICIKRWAGARDWKFEQIFSNILTVTKLLARKRCRVRSSEWVHIVVQAYIWCRELESTIA